MATTETETHVSQEAVDLWNRSYQGEVLGEAYFGHMAAKADDSDRRRKLEALATLERCTKELIAAAMARLGLPAEPDPEVASHVAQGTDFDYGRMIKMLPPIAADYLGTYTRLRQLVGPDEAGTVDQVIAHEMALELFARRELDGETEDSLEPIRALSHVTL